MHSEAPWIFELLSGEDDGLGYIYASDHNLLKPICHHGDDGYSRNENIANGKLIAAAPELLKALELILPLAKGYRPEGQTETAKRTCQSWISVAEKAVEKAKLTNRIKRKHDENHISRHGLWQPT